MAAMENDSPSGTEKSATTETPQTEETWPAKSGDSAEENSAGAEDQWPAVSGDSSENIDADELLDVDDELLEDDLENLPLFDEDDIDDDIEKKAGAEANKKQKAIQIKKEAGVEKESKKEKPAGTTLLVRLRARAVTVKGWAMDRMQMIRERFSRKQIIWFVSGGALLLVLSSSLMMLSTGSDAPSVSEIPTASDVPAETISAETLAEAQNALPPAVQPADEAGAPPPASPPKSKPYSDVAENVDTAAPGHSGSVENYHAAGVDHFRQGRYPEAIEAFESDITSSYLFLARCYQIMGENEEALKRYQRVLWEYPDRHAFTEVFSLAEEMFAVGDYEKARQLYYAFISHVDKMPGSVKQMVPRAYFMVCRCFEEEALNLMQGIHSAGGPETATAGGVPIVDATGGTDETLGASWNFSTPYKVHMDAKRVNDFLMLFTLECIGAPALEVFEELAEKIGRRLVVSDELSQRLKTEMVSSFLQERQVEEILEYLTGQIGLTYKLDEKRLKIEMLDNQVQGDWMAMKEEAVKAFRRSLYRFLGHDDAPKVYFEISRLHYLSGDFDSAINPAKTLIVEYPEFSQIPLTLLNISHCHMELGDYGKARQYLSELVNKYTAHPAAQEGYLLLARCWWKEGNPAAARLTLRALEDRFPGSTVRHEGQAILARILFSQQQYGKVVKLLEPIDPRTVENKETAVSILLLKSEAQLRNGAPDVAVKSVIELLESFPNCSRKQDALYILAESYLALDQHLMAYATCKSLKRDYATAQDDPFMYIMAGKALRALEFSDMALEWLDTGLDRCVEGTRDVYEMYMLLGDILFDLGQFERAKVVYKKVREYPEFEKAASLKYVRSLVEQKDFEGALEVILSLIAWVRDDPQLINELHKLAGNCYEALGDMDAAINAYCGKFDSPGESQKADPSQQ